MAPPLTPADLAALTKVQARVKGWALRNKMRLARLEEAAAAGGPHAVFSLSPKDCGRLRDVFPCGLRTVSACGTLYVFDKHLAYHSEAAPAGVFSPARDEVKMCVPLSCVAHVCAKEEYVSEPGVLVTLGFRDADSKTATTKTSATKVWWGGMHSPSLVVDALERALVDAKGGLRSSASVERARAARAMVRKAVERDATNRNVIERLANEIAGHKFAARRAEAERDEARDQLRDALAAFDVCADAPRKETTSRAEPVAKEDSEKDSEKEDPDETFDDARVTRLVGALAEAKRRATRAERALAEQVARSAATETRGFEPSNLQTENKPEDAFVSLSPTAETSAELASLRASLDAARAELVAKEARLAEREKEASALRDAAAAAAASRNSEETAATETRHRLRDAQAALAAKSAELVDARAAAGRVQAEVPLEHGIADTLLVAATVEGEPGGDTGVIQRLGAPLRKRRRRQRMPEW